MEIDIGHRWLTHSIAGHAFYEARLVPRFDLQDEALPIPRVALWLDDIAVQPPGDDRLGHSLGLAHHLEDCTYPLLREIRWFNQHLWSQLHFDGVLLDHMTRIRVHFAVVVPGVTGLHVGHLQAAIRPEHYAIRRRELRVSGVHQSHIVPMPTDVAEGSWVCEVINLMNLCVFFYVFANSIFIYQIFKRTEQISAELYLES